MWEFLIFNLLELSNLIFLINLEFMIYFAFNVFNVFNGHTEPRLMLIFVMFLKDFLQHGQAIS